MADFTKQSNAPKSLKAFLPALAAYGAGAFYLVLLWHRNYNRLGHFYDYSILASACGHLWNGLKPYRDFTTPLQSLTLYLCFAAESVFGRNYLALAYGNLVLGLAGYGAALVLLRKYSPLLLRVVIAAGFCSATIFQHGILWYNSIALLLSLMIVWWLADWHRQGMMNWRQPVLLGFLLYLSSMSKLNFFALNLALTAALLRLIFFRLTPTDRKRLLFTLPWLAVAGLFLGPLTEILVNRTTFHDFLNNVLATPQSRSSRLINLLNPNLYFGRLVDTYPDNWSGGIYLKACLLYAGCLYFFVRKATVTETASASFFDKLKSPRWLASLLLALFFAASLMLTVSNVESQMLTSAFLMVGLVAVFVMFAPGMSEAQSSVFKLSIFVLSGFFLLAGGTSAFMHSRIRFSEPSWTDATLRALYAEKNLKTLDDAVPFYDLAAVDPRMKDYFAGVKVTAPAHKVAREIFSVMNHYDLNEKTDVIYWGPGLEIMNRVFYHKPKARLPLWYDLGTTVNNGDAPRLIAMLRQCDYEWIIASAWFLQMPREVREFINQTYDLVEDDDDAKFFRKKTLPVNALHAQITAP